MIHSVVLHTTHGDASEIEPIMDGLRELLPGVPVRMVSGRPGTFPVEQPTRTEPPKKKPRKSQSGHGTGPAS